MNNIEKIEKALTLLFEVVEDTGDDVGLLIKKPGIDYVSSYRVVYGDNIYTGEMWRGFSDGLYFSGSLFDEV